MKIGFIGTGWIGNAYSKNFKEREYKIVKYSLDPKYKKNKDKIKDCEITIIAVPTPTTPDGFNYDILNNVLNLIGDGNIAVIKSTILPDVTNKLQKKYPNIFILHSPEFLTENTAEFDVKYPKRNIVGIPIDNKEYRSKAQLVIDILPKAPYNLICSAEEASFIKYGGNCFYYFKVMFINMLYDLTQVKDYNVNWENIKNALAAEPMVGNMHLNPVHKGGRGAGNHCLLKDMEAFKTLYGRTLFDPEGWLILSGLVKKNIDYLIKSNKDLEILKGVYGDEITNLK